MAPLHRSILVGPLLARIRDAGEPVSEIAARYGIDAGSDAAVSLPLPVFRAFCDEAAARLGEPALGLRLALDLRRGTYGVTEFIVRAAPRFRDAVRLIVDNTRLVHSLAVMTCKEEHGDGILEMRLPGEPEGQGAIGNEFALCMGVIIARQIEGPSWRPKRAWLAHEGAADPELVAFLGTSRIEYGKGANGIRFEAALLDARGPLADEALYDYLRPQMDAAAAHGRSEHDRLRDRVRELVARGEPTLERLASTLHTSPRTLQRKLSDLGTSFRDLSDDVRCALATEWLGDPKMTLDDIAERLAYSDVRALRRAYKRRIGRTLIEARASLTPPRARATRLRTA